MQTTDIIRKDSEKFVKEPNLPNYEEGYKGFSWEMAATNVDFFEDGTFNAAYNAIDRHVANGKGDKVALHYKGANEEKESYTFGDLKNLSDKFANVLNSQNVAKGDRVFIFLPAIPERYVAFLGILKLGAIAGTMFAAFQEMALLDRLSDSQAKVVITNAALYPRIEKIWKDLPHLEKVIIVERGSVTQPQEDKLIYYNEEMKKASADFAV